MNGVFLLIVCPPPVPLGQKDLRGSGTIETQEQVLKTENKIKLFMAFFKDVYANMRKIGIQSLKYSSNYFHGF